jgi:sugar phosphate isomerase/epimerase
MDVSVATANLYFLPFEETLEIIAEAGFRNIELDLFWEWHQWTMAQHLQNVPVSQAIQSIHRSGLKVTSIHDGGGVLNHHNSTENYINPRLDEYLDELGYAPAYMVFHPPHAEGNLGVDWWNNISGEILRALEKYRTFCSCLTLENMPFFEGFTVPLTTPEELGSFVSQHGLAVNIDTTHYAQIGVNLLEAGRILGERIHSVHLSDYAANRAHAFVGEGDLDLAGFFRQLDTKVLLAVTLECSVSSTDRSDRQMSHIEIVNRMKILKNKVDNLPLGGHELKFTDPRI